MTMADDDQDKRAAPRLSYPCDVECVGLGVNPTSPRISDLSATGAFVDCINTLPVGSRLVLRFSLPFQDVTATAEVVHAMPQFGMGVRFLDLSPAARGAIEQLVREGSP
jgi:PilZ domain-containing protein